MNNSRTPDKNIFKKTQGFSLVEVIISVFIFSLMMLALAGFFANSFSGFKNARAIQKDLEDAQFVMNLMAKTIRTSSVVGSNGTQLKIYDHSRTGNKCIIYWFANNNILTGSAIANDEEECSSAGILSVNAMNSGYVSGNFLATESDSASDPKVVGKVTISMQVCATLNCAGKEKDKARIQTTVSLRDYEQSMSQ